MNNKHNRKWIDIGAGVGELVYSAQKSGWDAIGFEIDCDSIDFGKKLDINLQQAYMDENFDYSVFNEAGVVSFINILEHIENPKDFISNISNAMPSNSHFLIEVPRTPSLSSYLNKVFPDNSNRHIYSPDHLHIFSEKSLNLLLSENNFISETCWYYGQDMSDLFTNLALEGSIVSDKIFKRIELLSNQLQYILDKNELSDTMIILARKL